MPRANRHLLNGRTYHVTHRCHDRRFLLKFVRDRDAYRAWLRSGRDRFNVRVLSYCITSNHVHLLVRARETKDLSGLMQFVEGASAQAYNVRKRRRGAFWSDRYHATMIEDGSHLWRCLTYIDLNMVRAGVVDHPREWAWTGWQELMGERRRNCVVDTQELVSLVDAGDIERFRIAYAEAIALCLKQGGMVREPEWSESVAIGSGPYIEAIRKELTADYSRRSLETEESAKGGLVLREKPEVAYGAEEGLEKDAMVSF